MEVDPDFSAASIKLRNWILSESLVLVSSLKLWSEEGPSHQPVSLETLLVRHVTDIAESRWLDKLDSLPEEPLVYPLGFGLGVCATALEPAAEVLQRLYAATILMDRPLLVVGLLNPWSGTVVSRFVAHHFPGRAHTLVCISPHSFAHYLAALARRQEAPAVDWSTESLEDWCRLLTFDASSFASVDALVDNLWRGDPPYMVLAPYSLESGDSILPDEFVCILQRTKSAVWVATTKPSSQELLDRLYQTLPGRRVRLLAVSPREAARLAAAAARGRLQDLGVEVEEQRPLVVHDWKIIREREDEAWNRILEAGIRIGASDIHLDPKADRIRVRFGIDGTLMEQAPIQIERWDALLKRIKIKGNMMPDRIAECQDGRGHHQVHGLRYDQRYSILPLKENREKVVVRIFTSAIRSLQMLGLGNREFRSIQWFLQQGSGMMIVCGPTGSGKTTTLYACLNELNTPRVSILTLEEPTEKHLEDANQVDIRPHKGLTFAAALRTAMRQAPNIIMVGEIRDQESAAIAISLALTGHQMFSSLHTDDTVDAIERLKESFKIDKATIGDAVRLIVAQRLIPRLCPACRLTRDLQPGDMDDFLNVEVADPMIGEPVGCPSCRGTGFAGRESIMEILPVDPVVKSMLQRNAGSEELRRYQANLGFATLAEQATKLVLTGCITTQAARRFMRRAMGT